jgi:hypothetical protein
VLRLRWRCLSLQLAISRLMLSLLCLGILDYFAWTAPKASQQMPSAPYEVMIVGVTRSSPWQAFQVSHRMRHGRASSSAVAA